MTESDLQYLARLSAEGRRDAQRRLYDHFKGKMFGVCLRYAGNRQDAEDWLQEGFVRVFRDLHQYRGAGSLEGWIRRVIVHTALHYIKQQKRRLLEEDQLRQDAPLDEEDHPSVFESEETPKAVLQLMQQLPLGFRTVLNLYVLENYSHQQIADELGISVGTSKSQLNRAKAFLRALLEKNLTR
jgi:RNA polymerase sigma factor (sigma-70 family)